MVGDTLTDLAKILEGVQGITNKVGNIVDESAISEDDKVKAKLNLEDALKKLNQSLADIKNKVV